MPASGAWLERHLDQSAFESALGRRLSTEEWDWLVEELSGRCDNLIEALSEDLLEDLREKEHEGA